MIVFGGENLSQIPTNRHISLNICLRFIFQKKMKKLLSLFYLCRGNLRSIPTNRHILLNICLRFIFLKKMINFSINYTRHGWNLRSIPLKQHPYSQICLRYLDTWTCSVNCILLCIYKVPGFVWMMCCFRHLPQLDDLSVCPPKCCIHISSHNNGSPNHQMIKHSNDS